MHRADHRAAAAPSPEGKRPVRGFWQSKMSKIQTAPLSSPSNLHSGQDSLSLFIIISIKQGMSQLLRPFRPLSGKHAVFLEWQRRGHLFGVAMGFLWPLADVPSVWCLWFHPKPLGSIAR